MRTICLCTAACLAAGALQAQAPTDSTRARADTAVRIQGIVITAAPSDQVAVKPLQLLTMPTTASLTLRQARQTVNIVDTQDAVKYMPSVMMRKRNNGDGQTVMGTRIWGVGGSARSLVFADGILLSTLIGNNNTFASPKWGLVSPIEIARIDMMMGPYSAAYAGNSIGAVMEITTRQPEKFEGAFNQTHAIQRFDLYGTKKTFNTAQSSVSVGNRFGRLSFWASGNYQDSRSQPLGYVTAATFPASTTGGFADVNKLGAAANVLGATGLLHTHMLNAKLKTVLDITAALKAAYTFGLWRNDATSAVQSYLTGTSAQPVFAAQAGFATSQYDLFQQHTAHMLSVRSDTKKDWDVDVSGSYYHMDQDRQRAPVTAGAADTAVSTTGRVAVLGGTQWFTLDAKAAWHKGGIGATHIVSFGVHQDQYELNNPTYNTTDWTAGQWTTVATEGDGKTRNSALWAQDAWQVTGRVRATFGARYETWHAFDGFNQNGNTVVVQPESNASRFSPKLVVDWRANRLWSVTFSGGKAYRFPTASELYQLVTTGTTFTSPVPDLKPDNAWSGELRIQRRFDEGQAQVAFFGQDVRDAIISQFQPLVPGSSTLFSYLSNVDHVRAGGVEALAAFNNVGIHGLQLTGNLTWLDARIVAISGAASATSTPNAAVGKFLPNIPKWRAGYTVAYRPTPAWAFSFAGRYSSMLYTTLDNSDVRNPNVYQGFTAWFVADARVNYTQAHWSASLGVDNLTNRKYFLFHPFPQRTLVGDLRFTF